MNDRMSQRFQMLIDVAISGGGNFGKLAKGAKKAAIDLKSFNKFLDENEADLKGTRAAIQSYVTTISKIPSKHGAMEKALVTYNSKLKTSREIIQNLEATLKLNKLAQDRLTEADVKGTVAVSKYTENLHRLQAEQKQNNQTLQKTRLNQIKLKGTFQATEKEYQRFIITTKKGGIVLANYDRRNQKNTLHQKQYSGTLRTAKRALVSLNKQIKENSKDAKINAVTQGKQEKALKKVGHEVRHVRDEFKDWHDMRIRGDKTLKIFRQSLGAIRNQLLVLAFATRGLKVAFDKAFTSSRRMEAALKGLGSVAMNTGAAFGVGEKAAIDLAKKGLLSVSDAAAGLKNLLSAGYGLPEAIGLMNTLTDAASFNRQGTLALGEAVVGATQGIKNQNSIMVDNAGITKNLSIMYKEYAARIGTTMGKLTEIQKRQAIYNGILQEGSIFAGDAIKVLSTMEGSLAKLKAQSFVAYAALGDVLKPVMEGIVSVFTEGSQVVADFFNDKTFKVEILRKARDLGRDLGESIRILATGIGSLVGGINKLLPPFGVWSLTLLKIVGVLKLKNAIMGRVTKGQKAMTAELKNTVMWTELETMRIKSRNIVEKRKNTSLRGLLITMRAYKAELITTDLVQKKAMLSAQGLEGTWKRTIFTLGTLKARLIATVGAFRAVGGATVFLVAGLKALWATLGPLLIAFAAFQAIAWVVDKVFGANKRVEETNRALSRQAKIYGALNIQMKGISKTVTELQKKGADVGVSGFDMSMKLGVLRAQYKTISELHEEYQQAKTEKQRTAIENRLEDQQEGFDKALSALTLSQQKLTAETQKYYDKRNAIDAFYIKVRDSYFKDEKIKAIVAAENTYQELLKQQKSFNTIRKEMAKRGYNELEAIESKLAFATLTVIKQRNKVMIELFEDLANKIQTISDKYSKYAAKSTGDAFDRIINNNKVLKEQALAQLDEYAKAAETRMEGLKLMYKFRTLEAADDFNRAMQKFQFDVPDQGGGIQKRMSTLARAIIPDTKELAKTKSYLKDLFTGIDSRPLVESVKRLEAVREMALDLRDTFSAQKKVGGISMMQELLTNIDAVLPSLKNKVEVDKASTEQQKRMNIELEKFKVLIANVQKEIDAGTAAQIRAQLAAEDYRQTTKQLQMDLRKTANSQKELTWAMDLEQLKEQNKMTLEHSRGIAVILPLKEKLIELERKHTEGILKANQAYEKEAKNIADRKQLLSDEKSVWFDKLDTVRMINGEVIQYTDKEKEAIFKRIDALNAELAILEKKKFMFKDLLETTLAFLDNQADDEKRKAFQENLGEMTKAGYAFVKSYTVIGKKIKAEQRKTNAEWDHQLKTRQINQEQHDQLTLASAKYYKAKQKMEEAKFTADLVRQIGQQVLAYAAKKAAASGNIFAALAWLGGGVAAKAIIDRQADRIEDAATDKFNRAELEYQTRQEEITGAGTGSSTDVNRTFGGTIKAENLDVKISPTVILQGETIFIGQGTVTEFASELQQLILKSTQEAIDNREIDLSAIANIGG